MGISKSCNGLIISSNEKFITLKVSWPSWTDFVGVLERELRDVLLMEFRDGLGFDPHFRGRFNFIYNFYYIDSVSLSKSGVLGFWGLSLYIFIPSKLSHPNPSKSFICKSQNFIDNFRIPNSSYFYFLRDSNSLQFLLQNLNC